MTVKWIRYKNNHANKIDITNAVASISWSGSTSQAARTTEITVLNAPNDKNITGLNLKIAAGDLIKLCEDNTVIFIGTIITKEITSETGTVTYSCADFLNRLLKSTGVYNFSDTTAERITKRVCTDFKISTGTIIETKAPIKKMIIDGSSIYDIIMMAYTKAAKQTGQKYICRMEGTKLTVKKKGTVVKNFMLAEQSNITNTTQEETIENMVNIVKIYDDNRKQLGEVKNNNLINKYGIYQQIYKKEKGVNAQTAAKNMLTGIEKKVTLDSVNGNLSCIAGNGVKVYDKATKLTGIFWIESDTYTWENGVHTMNLELNYKNLMDSKEYEE